MPRVDYRAIWRTNRTEIAFFLPAKGDAQALQVVAVRHRRGRSARWSRIVGDPEAIRLFSRPIRNVKSTSRQATAPPDDLNYPITGLRSGTLN